MFWLIKSNSLCFERWTFCHPLANLFPHFWPFFVFFWITRTLVTIYKPCHLPHASRITTWRTLFTEIHLSVSKESVRSWPHAFLLIYHKTFAKEIKAVGSKSCRKREKEKEAEQESCEDLSVCLLNILPKVSSYMTSSDLTLVIWLRDHIWEPLTLSYHLP